MAGKGLAELRKLDLSSLNDGKLVVSVIFPKSTAKNYPMAVAIAELSSVYKIGVLADKQFHLASFTNESNQLALAANLTHLIYGITGVQAYINGERVLCIQELSLSLSCFARSLRADNSAAYCECVSNYPGKYMLPCRLLVGWEGRISENLPYSLKDQIQALAVSKGCSWCPNFKPERIKRI